MAEHQQKLEITPKVIDTGTSVVQMAHVTSAGFGAAHPFRPLGLVLIVIALGLVGSAVAREGTAAFALTTAGSPVLWVAFGAAGIGLFLTVFARRFLVVRTVDGARTTLAAGDDAASAAVIARIREAMERSGADVGESRPALAAPVGHNPGEVAVGQSRAGAPRGLPASAGQPASRNMITAEPRTGQPAAQNHPRRLDGYVNGINGHGVAPGDPHSGPPAEAAGGTPRRQLSEYVPPRTQPDRGYGGSAELPHGGGGVGGPAGGGGMDPRLQIGIPGQREPAPLQLPSGMAQPPLRDDPQGDLHALMDHVRQANVQHKEALIDLLQVIDEHYRGRTSREDAIAHWHSFSDYVVQYLSDVDGLVAITERFGRHMSSR